MPLVPCFNPIPAWRDDEPNPKTGKHGILFSKHADHLHSDLDLPCGRCKGCRGDKARDWGIRIYHESLSYDQSAFLTLTYDDEHLPADGKLNKQHLVEFIDRLRNSPEFTWRPRYFAVGEYGETTGRAHYHMCLFGADFRDCLSTTIRDGMYEHPFVNHHWRKGQVAIAPLEPASAMYVAGYCQKKIGQPETFNTMSRGSIRGTNGMLPPIGYRWAEKHKHDLSTLGHLVIEGRKQPIPKVYFDWFPDALADAKDSRRLAARYRNGIILRRRETNYSGKLATRQETI